MASAPDSLAVNPDEVSARLSEGLAVCRAVVKDFELALKDTIRDAARNDPHQPDRPATGGSPIEERSGLG